VIRQRGKSTQVMVYAGRDPLTGRKRWVSRQVAGTGRAALKEAKQIEAQLLAEVAAGRHQDANAPPRATTLPLGEERHDRRFGRHGTVRSPARNVCPRPRSRWPSVTRARPTS